MQTSKEQLMRQQLILKGLGYYRGEINGVWGPHSIDAKKAYECSTRFVPGIPNNGLPFREGTAYPAGITLQKDGLFYHPCIEQLLMKSDEAPKTEEPAVVESKSKNKNLR